MPPKIISNLLIYSYDSKKHSIIYHSTIISDILVKTGEALYHGDRGHITYCETTVNLSHLAVPRFLHL